jgi:two-component system NtrC family sensor kinase
MHPSELHSDPALDNRRVLIVDDNEAIHEDFKKIIGPTGTTDALDEFESDLFGDTHSRQSFDIDSAFQGDVGYQRVCAAVAAGAPYALAFVDVRMPPGMDGIETTANIIRADPDISVVICSAYSDHSWDEIIDEVGESDRVLILRKPFDSVEVRQLAFALRQRWVLSRQASMRMNQLEERVRLRTRELEEANQRVLAEVEAREKIEMERRIAHKLEAVGQLAAGVAHEINTPMQYVGDNVHFLSGAFEDLLSLIGAYRREIMLSLGEAPHGPLEERLRKADREADLEYLLENVPQALEMTQSGIARVTEIVRSMKEFSHPDQKEQAPFDVNQALKNVLVVARNEYKYVADVTLELETVPEVICHGGEVGQVFLNILVNAAHAIASVADASARRGEIVVRSRAHGEDVVVEFQDNGGGIPEDIRHRIFDPFFTTKEVGVGTGQGLAISRAVIDKHGGSIVARPAEERGTVFCVRLPARPRTEGRAA